MATYDIDEHFRQFASTLEKSIATYPETGEEHDEKQKRQVETLVELEKEFRLTLIDSKEGQYVYKEFIRHIRDVRQNILAARPFFRERHTVFASGISNALKRRYEISLYQYHINYNFIRFALNTVKWRKNSKIVKLAKEIERLRIEIATQNMPLAISRARIFWSRTPKSQLTYMDLVQIASEGLMSAIDKFVLPYSPVFRAVIIGRVTGNCISCYSETMLHFYPGDRKKLYRAHKTIGRANDASYEQIADKVNDGLEEIHKTDADEIFGLISAASTVSADSLFSVEPDTGEAHRSVDQYPAENESRPDVQFEEVEARHAIVNAIAKLSVLEQKILRLKGIYF